MFDELRSRLIGFRQFCITFVDLHWGRHMFVLSHVSARIHCIHACMVCISLCLGAASNMLFA